MITLNNEQIKYLFNSKSGYAFKHIVGEEKVRSLQVENEKMKYIKSAISLKLDLGVLFELTEQRNIKIADDIEKAFNSAKSEFYLTKEDIELALSISGKSFISSDFNHRYEPERLAALRDMIRQKIDIWPVLDPRFSSNFIKDYSSVELWKMHNIKNILPEGIETKVDKIKEILYDRSFEDLIAFCKVNSDNHITKDYVNDINIFRYKKGLIDEPYNLEELGIDDYIYPEDWEIYEKFKDPWQNNYDEVKSPTNKQLLKNHGPDIEERP